MQKKHLTQLIIVSIGLVLMLIKFWAFIITDSNAILTDALESIINVLAGFFTLYSIILSDKPKDDDHPYGHGKIEFVSSAVEGILIFTAGVLMIVKSIENLVIGHELRALDIGIVLTVIAGIVNYMMGAFLQRYSQKIDSIALEAQGKHLKSDAYSSLAMILGLAVIYVWNFVWLDNLIAISFALIIAYTGVKIIRKSMAGIMDEVDTEILRRLVDILSSQREKEWIDIHNLRAIKYGAMLHVDCHMTLPWYITVRKAHEQVKKVEAIVDIAMKKQVEMFIHVDDCLESSCQICEISDCLHRKNPFKEKVDWNLERLLKNEKHQILKQRKESKTNPL